jgi:3-methyladenine DNA glycosylase AlkD
MIAEPKRQDEALMEAWVREFSYWEICDQVCMNLFEKSPLAYAKAVEWSQRQAEFEKRAGFVLMARLAVSDKQAPDDCFLPFFEQIIAESADPRNFVKKAVNWALRQIGKRNRKLNLRAIEICHQLLESQNSSSSWIARDALRELESLAIQKRLKC